MKLSHIPRLAGIYRIVHSDSGKCYIGSALSLYERGHNHAFALGRGQHCNRHLQNAWKAYGAAAFQFEVIELVPDRDRLREREDFYIQRFDACNRAVGYNLALTAVRVTFSDETRQHLSRIKKGRIVSAEARRRISEALKGKLRGPHSEAHRNNLARALKGKIRSAEQRRNIAIARARQDPASLSHPHTQETIERLRALAKARPVPEGVGAEISAALTGRKRGPHTEEAKAKIGAKAKARGPHSEAHRKALSEGQKRRGARGPHTEERKLNISLAKKRANAERRAAMTGAVT